MNTNKRSVLMMSAPALGAFLLGAVLLGGIVSNTTDKIAEGMQATGYVTVSIIRDGNEIYHYEDHNVITDEGRDFILQQIGGTASTATAQYIALSDDDSGIDASHTTLEGEIDDDDGLQRKQGTFEQGEGEDADSFTIRATFTASGNHSNIQKAGLFTASENGTMVAENTFASVNLAANDQLTITWRIDLGLNE